MPTIKFHQSLSGRIVAHKIDDDGFSDSWQSHLNYPSLEAAIQGCYVPPGWIIDPTLDNSAPKLRPRPSPASATELDDDGRRFLGYATGPMGDPLVDLDLHSALRYVGWEPDDLTYPVVTLRSTISRAERMRRFGCLGIERANWSGRCCGKAPIPTDEYIQIVTRAFGDYPEYRTIELARCRGKTLVQKLNNAGRELRNVESGCFEPVGETRQQIHLLSHQ